MFGVRSPVEVDVGGVGVGIVRGVPGSLGMELVVEGGDVLLSGESEEVFGVRDKKGYEYKYPVAKITASMSVSIHPSSNSIALVPESRKRCIEGTVVRVAVSGVVLVLGLVESVDG